jgi:hypothetical protein
VQLVRIDENEWIDRFKPETLPDGSYYRQRDPYDPEDKAAIDVAARENRLWTAVDGDDGQWCLISGYHYVNRLYYVICEVPYDLTDSTEEVYVCDDEQETITN